MTAQTILPANSVVSGGYAVDNSCRFDDGDSAYMTKTPDSAGNRDRWTFSTWTKRGNLSGEYQTIISTSGGSADDTDYLYFNADDTLHVHLVVSGSAYGTLYTNKKFRDISAWYHIILVYDSGNGTAGDRLIMYINGVRETSFSASSFPDQNADSVMTLGSGGIDVGRDGSSSGSGYLDGYLAETVLIDGLALDATSFGEFDDSGIWKPIDVSGLTFGTNGFYLDFKDSSNLGNDANGGTDFGETNIAATDQSTDTCTNNFNTYSPLWAMQAIRVPIFAEGNLKITGDGDANHHQVMGTFAVNKGKWYWEAKFTVSADLGKNKVGIMSVDLGTPQTAEIVDQSGSCVFINEDGGDFRRDNATVDQNSGVFTQNQIIGVALNMDDGEISIYRDNSLIVDALDIGNADGTYVTPASMHYRSAGMEFNFGSAPYALTSAAADGDGFGAFEFAPPSGYFALCSKNLAEYG